VLKPHDKGHGETIVKRGGGKHKHDEHGGAWKVAFADFCLALMCLFLVLWLMAARNTESLEAVLTESDGNRTDQGKGVMPQQVGGPRGSLIERFPMPRTGYADVQGEGKSKDPADPQPAKVNYQSPEDLKKLADALAEMSKDAGLANNLESVITPYGTSRACSCAAAPCPRAASPPCSRRWGPSSPRWKTRCWWSATPTRPSTPTPAISRFPTGTCRPIVRWLRAPSSCLVQCLPAVCCRWSAWPTGRR
jgi:hypothetical protein